MTARPGWLTMVGMRRWLWRGSAVVVGLVVAAAFAAAGQWQGGLVGAGIIGVGIFLAPEVSERLRERRLLEADRQREDAAALTFLDHVSSPAVSRLIDEVQGSAAWWLRPDQRVVDFIDRPELAKLREWCANDDASEVMLLTGAGGVGKTRLAQRVAEEQQEAGWLCRLVRPGMEAEVVGAAREVSRGPLLLIVDYAETRPGLAELIRAVAGDKGGRLRVVLLARGAGEWWAQLEGFPDHNVRRLVAAAGPVPVSTVLGEMASGADLVRAALPEFARAVGTAVPAQVEVQIPAGPVPILVLHAAALLAVLDSQGREPNEPVRLVANEEVLIDLLRRERTFWLGSARMADDVDSVVAAQAVAVACLIGVGTETEAVGVLRRIPDLGDASLGQLHRIARWLRQLYPADPSDPSSPSRWWGHLQPDLLAELHVIAQLADAPDFAGSCLRDLTAEQARGAMTMLARACAHRDEAGGLIAAALRADLIGLGVPAVAVAVQTGGSLGKVLAEVVSDAEAVWETLTGIENAIPYPTVVLAEAHAILIRRIIQSLPEDINQAELAQWNDRYGVVLHQVGRLHEALLVSQEAVKAYRGLAVANPDRYRPDLARSLDHLGVRFSELGRPAEALPVTGEAVEIRRGLAVASPERYRPDLARSLDHLGIRFSELGRLAEAVPVTEEAVRAYRALAAASPERYRPDLARSLSNLGANLSKLGRQADAVPVIQEAVVIRRELAAESPDRYSPGLAHALTNLGLTFSELGRLAEAVPVTEEAVKDYQALAAVSPERYRPDLARSLSNLGELLAQLGRLTEAVSVTELAVAIRRELVMAFPDRHRPGLGSSLNNLGLWLSDMGRPADALPCAQQAVAIRRELALAFPDRHRLELASSLDNVTKILSTLERDAEAAAARAEAAAIREGS
jgi:tetratricopeptide (TPR) repeat protein